MLVRFSGSHMSVGRFGSSSRQPPVSAAESAPRSCLPRAELDQRSGSTLCFYFSLLGSRAARAPARVGRASWATTPPSQPRNRTTFRARLICRFWPPRRNSPTAPASANLRDSCNSSSSLGEGTSRRATQRLGQGASAHPYSYGQCDPCQPVGRVINFVHPSQKTPHDMQFPLHAPPASPNVGAPVGTFYDYALEGCLRCPITVAVGSIRHPSLNCSRRTSHPAVGDRAGPPRSYAAARSADGTPRLARSPRTLRRT